MLIQITFSILLSFLVFIFPFLNHPLAMGLNLLFSTLLIGTIMGVSMSSFWISYTLLLILSGGLLVIFVYVALLASNESFKTNLGLCSFLLSLSTIIFVSNNWFKMDNGSSNYLSNLNVSMKHLLSMLYSKELYQFTLFIIIYLLVTLLVVVYITKKNNFPLRSTK